MISEKEIYKKALEKWGKNFQIDMAIEEMAELIVKLAKRKRKINGSTNEEICSEIADVEIMMQELRLIFGDVTIDVYKKLKLERLEKLIQNAIH